MTKPKIGKKVVGSKGVEKWINDFFIVEVISETCCIIESDNFVINTPTGAKRRQIKIGLKEDNVWVACNVADDLDYWVFYIQKKSADEIDWVEEIYGENDSHSFGRVYFAVSKKHVVVREDNKIHHFYFKGGKWISPTTHMKIACGSNKSKSKRKTNEDTPLIYGAVIWLLLGMVLVVFNVFYFGYQYEKLEQERQELNNRQAVESMEIVIDKTEEDVANE